ncbi:MAG: hypothetical protein F6K16_40940, partial [Symploca sp. SIO2B6]|nr:hypothetical protein [Symploca sp. SIO2B6]
CFFQGILSKLLLATAFFLPLRLYVEILHISQPYAAQFACLGLSSVGVRWLLIHWATANRWRKNLGLVFTLAFMVASLWVSSFSIVYLVVLLGAIAHYIFILTPSHERRQRYPLDISTGLAAGITGAFGLGFLKLAKASASNSSDYTKLNSLAQFTDLLQRIGQNVLRNLRFEVHRIWMPLAVWCLVAIAGCSLYFIWRYRHNLFSAVSGATHQKGPLWPPTLWFGVWGLTAGLSMGILLIANWVYQTDHIPQRYFVVIYGLCWLTVLSLVEILPKRPQLTLFVLLILFTGFSIKTLPPRLFSTPAQSPMVKQLEVLNTLGPAGFIGEYWHSYVLCSANPQLFNCTPFDPWSSKERCPKGRGKPYELGYPIRHAVRCERCAENVLNSPSIYVVKQQWLDEFPKRLEQFGYCLRRVGEPFTIVDRDVALYKKLE